MSSPPFNIIKKEEDKYSLTLDFDEMLSRFGILSKVLGPPPPGPVREGEGKTVGKVTAGMFKHIGGGIFVLKTDESVRLDLNKSSREVEATLKKHGLGTENLGGFYYQLRTKAGLIRH